MGTVSINTIIRWSFYLLFFLVPLIFSPSTSELFEYNKMMLTYALTIIVVTIWIIKMILANKIIYKRTFLEIPLLLYLLSHLLSTIFSIDPHISLWGYYSRFHEGFLASISYVLLYFAAVSNLTKNDVKKIFFVSFASAVIVSFWGIMEHFGNSPSCMLITGKPGVDCWIQDVQNRVYATLGQPNWMAAYLCAQILIAIGFVHRIKNFELRIKSIIHNSSFIILPLFFTALLFTKSRSGIAGLAVGLGIFFLLNIKKINKYLLILISLLILLSLLIGFPFNLKPATNNQKPVLNNPEILISESGDIRKVVWTGAIKVWQRYPIFGSGVETFGYSYYLDRPAEHNLLSEWDFLYNKAHNEYLNILATTGTVGMITYALIIICSLKLLFKNPALLGAYTTILVTNFFGFSVVIIGLYFFLIPAFYEILSD